MKRILQPVIVALLFFLLPIQVSAATQTFNQITIFRLISQEGSNGDCMALTNVLPTVVNCSINLVSFSCDGLYNSPQVGKMKYSLALMAFTLGKKVTMTLDDTRKYNGICFANRVELTN